MGTQTKKVKKVDLQVHDLPGEFLACRTVGHSWLLPDRLERHPFGKMVVLTCRSCGMQRQDVYSILGDVTYRRYLHPDGYLFQGYDKDERPTRKSFRREWLHRVVMVEKLAVKNLGV